jgi:hypothetical protein
MTFDPDLTFIVEYILPELGRDIQTTASKTFMTTQKILESELYEFASKQGLIFQLENTTGLNGQERIHIFDEKKRTHVLALEIK